MEYKITDYLRRIKTEKVLPIINVRFVGQEDDDNNTETNGIALIHTGNFASNIMALDFFNENFPISQLTSK